MCTDKLMRDTPFVCVYSCAVMSEHAQLKIQPVGLRFVIHRSVIDLFANGSNDGCWGG